MKFKELLAKKMEELESKQTAKKPPNNVTNGRTQETPKEGEISEEPNVSNTGDISDIRKLTGISGDPSELEKAGESPKFDRLHKKLFRLYSKK